MSEHLPELPAADLMMEIARSLVDKPEDVSVKSTPHEGGTVLHLRVDPSDVGKVIGKQGRTARSLRTILGAVSVKLHHRYSLEIVEQPKPESASLEA
ncbi:MAG: KH domain-containing protein [Acidobacteriaceae bacterium]